jgi:hypothetical protein
VEFSLPEPQERVGINAVQARQGDQGALFGEQGLSGANAGTQLTVPQRAAQTM